MAGKPYNNPAVQSAVVDMEDRFEESYHLLEQQLRDQLDVLHRDGDLLMNDTFNVARVRNIVNNLQMQLRDVGFSHVLEEETQVLLDLADEILDEADKDGVASKFTATTGQDIENLLFGAQRAIVAIEGELAGRLEQAIIRSITGVTKWDDLVDEVQVQLGASLAQAKIKIADVISIFHNVVRTNHYTEVGIEWFLYDGPDDDRVRDWCSHWVGTRCTLESLDATADKWNRNHPLPPSVSLGGYNCRHELIPLAAEEDLAEYPQGPR